MKVLSADEMKRWDEYTIRHEPIASIDLMERAAYKCADWLTRHYADAPGFTIYCGKGNNGGDGLAIARMLIEQKYNVTVCILEFGHKGTDDFQTNLARLHKSAVSNIHFIQSSENLHAIPTGNIIVDALLGSGLNRPVEGVTAGVIDHLNKSGNPIIAIDIPSGLFVDRCSKHTVSVNASVTLSFQTYKPAFLFAENEAAVGQVVLLDIGLHPGFLTEAAAKFELTDIELIRAIYRPRNTFSHKGNFGHALLVAGSEGKMGAAVLAVKACLRSGSGLVTAHIPAGGYAIMQTSAPEAMVIKDKLEAINSPVIEQDYSRYSAIGIGPGLGTAKETTALVQQVLSSFRKPMVIDADALNIIAAAPDLLKRIPPNSILTPHPKEFERLFGASANDFDRAALASEKAKELQLVIVLKGHHTFIAMPGGNAFFNSTGNAGMATGGSGDVLTGILTGLLAQGYTPEQAAVFGVYLHGFAGDFAAAGFSMEAMIAGDIIEYLGKAFQSLQLPIV